MDKTPSSERNEIVGSLEAAEILLKFAFGISATFAANDRPRLNYLEAFSWGKHVSQKAELELTEKQERIAPIFLEHVATYLCAVQVDTAFQQVVPERFQHADPAIQSAAWIARLVRNAFAHNPFAPTWKLYPECENRLFSVPGVIELNTTGLHDKPVARRDYGGPLAILRLLWFAKELARAP